VGGDLSFYGMLAAGAIAIFALVIIIGMVVRFVKAPSGSRMRHAFGPLMGAGDRFQELHTGQKGLHDSVIESVQEQETKGAKRETGEGGSGEGATREGEAGDGDARDPSAR
jgi:hypothetical protein